MRTGMVLLAALMASNLSHGYDRPTGAAFASRSEVIATHGMAATSHPLATQVAIDILKAGGSAVDAAIAANATLGLMEPTGCGIGGDLFAIVWDANDKELTGLNASGRSPMSLSLEEVRRAAPDGIPYLGPLLFRAGPLRAIRAYGLPGKMIVFALDFALAGRAFRPVARIFRFLKLKSIHARLLGSDYSETPVWPGKAVREKGFLSPVPDGRTTAHFAAAPSRCRALQRAGAARYRI